MNSLGLVLPLVEFEILWPVLLLGIIAGLTYGLLGVGLALVYKSTRVINFAHGGVGALAATVMAVLTIDLDLPYVFGLAAAVALAIAVGLAVERFVVRRLERAPRLVLMVATIGVSQVLLAGAAFLPTEELQGQPFPVPFDVDLGVLGLRIHGGELLILLAVPAVTLGFAALWQRSKVGLAARAASENLEAARLAGIPHRKVSRVVWLAAALLSAAAAILYAPTQAAGTSLALGPSLMVRALAAAVLGGMTSLPQVAAAGVVVGVVETLVSWNYATSGAVDLVLLGLILVSLLLRRDLGRAARGGDAASWSLGGIARSLPAHLSAVPRVRHARRAALAAVALLAVLAPTALASGQQVLLSSIAIFAVMGLSLTILTGYGGQVSLGQFAFVGLGAVVAGRLHQLGYDSWVVLLYTVLAGGAVALVVGLPALRVRGLFLAVTTLSFAVAAQGWVPRQSWLVAVEDGRTSLELPRGDWFGIDFRDERNYYWLCLVVLLLTAAFVSRLRRTGTGRALMGVRDNEPAAAALTLPPRRVKLTAFVLAGMVAALGGWLWSGLLVNYTQANLFDPSLSLSLVAMVVFGGVTSVTGCLLGALWIRGIPYFLGSDWGILSSGVGVLLVLLFLPGGLAAVAFDLRDRAAAALARLPLRLPEAPGGAASGRERLPAAVAPERADGASGATLLLAEDIVVRFGGVTAVDGVSVHADAGEIVGLLGPNGAGKTTLFDVLSGQVRPAQGRVELLGSDVTDLRPEERALRGLGRSFQEARLFPELPLLDAFRLALERDDPSEVLPSALGLPASRAAERRKDLRATELVDLLGLGAFGHRSCGELSTGTRRFAELGLLVALGAKVVLLDEPTAGIAQREVEAFLPVLREIRDHLDATIVVIDHDIPMMSALVDRMYVMVSGKLIAEGPPDAVREDPLVVAAYLGTDERAIQRSGAATSAPSRRRRS